MSTETKRAFNKKHLIWMIPLALVVLMAIAFVIYTSNYYRANKTAKAALTDDELVDVSQTDFGWFFDGPSEENALVFYPGAKVEETAYAPLLHELATEGVDVFLISMPFHLAFFDIDAAASVMDSYEYAHWYVGGHSLGGAMSSEFAASNGDALDGVILLGAYASSELDDDLIELVIYGSEDHVLSMDRVEEGRSSATDHYVEYVIEGGNHAQFGDYGRQDGDGEATISATEQQAETIQVIVSAVS